jgi:anti-anti-sigma regulatory factor
MLKITTDTDAGRTILKLEGRLTGPWVEELNACWRDAAAETHRIEVVLHEVTFIDESGRRLLADMHRRGVELTAAGCMTKAIIEEIIRGEDLCQRISKK